MTLYTAHVTDKTGAIIWAMGGGMYVEAADAASAKAKADAEFRAPIVVEGDELAAKFLASVKAKQEAAIRDGYTLTVNRKR